MGGIALGTAAGALARGTPLAAVTGAKRVLEGTGETAGGETIGVAGIGGAAGRKNRVDVIKCFLIDSQ